MHKLYMAFVAKIGIPDVYRLHTETREVIAHFG